MPVVNRRRFLLMSAIALTATACGAPVAAGLRGSGTVLYPPETSSPSTTGTATAPTAEATETTSLPLLGPTPRPVPTVAPDASIEAEPIVPADLLPAITGGSTEAEMHVVPVLQGKPPITTTMPARRIVIPTIGLDSKVIQLGTKLDRKGEIAWETAPFAVGQHKGLAGPGQDGNMILSGHISSPNEGAIFHHLTELKVGEGVIVSTDERQYLYRVVEVKTVTPDQISVLDPTPDPTATLITCVPDGIYSHRLVVTAHLV
jgi:LPXTG-site transpeptidase (sortase) family protein